jgi:hypothetical protein
MSHIAGREIPANCDLRNGAATWRGVVAALREVAYQEYAGMRMLDLEMSKLESRDSRLEIPIAL